MFSISEIPMAFPPNFIDTWKLYFRFYENDKLMDCMMFEADIID